MQAKTLSHNYLEQAAASAHREVSSGTQFSERDMEEHQATES